MRKLIYSIMLMGAMYAQAELGFVYDLSQPVTYTSADGNNWILSYESTPIVPWTLPQISNTVLRWTMDAQTNAQGFVPDTSTIGTNVGIKGSSASFQSASNGITGCYALNGDANSWIKKPAFSQRASSMSYSVWMRGEAFNKYAFNISAVGPGFLGIVPTAGSTVPTCYGDTTDATYYILAAPETTLVYQQYWTHIVVTHNANAGARMYINGNLVVTNGSASGLDTSTGDLYAGAYQGSGGTIGWIGECVVWTNTVLTPDEVVNIHTNEMRGYGWANSLYYSDRPSWSNLILEFTADYSAPFNTAPNTNHPSFTIADSTYPSWEANGLGGSMIFDGVNDFVGNLNWTNKFDGTAVTSCAWIKVGNALGDANTIWGIRAPGLTGFGMYPDRTLYCFINDIRLTATNIVPSNEWHFVSQVWASNAVNEIYVDGIRIASSNGPSTNLLFSAYPALKVGADPNFSWKGNLDDVRWWNVAKSSNYIYNLYLSTTNQHPI